MFAELMRENQRYREQNTPWDLDGPSAVLGAVLDLGLLRERPRVLVPGCGRGHDVIQLAERGHDTLGVDFAPDAIGHLEAESRRRGLDIEARATDIFSLFDEPAGCLDAVVEYTCYCAIDPSERDRYRDLMTHLVRPGGRFVHLIFPLWREPGREGPPHIVTPIEVRRRFGEAWRCVLESIPPCVPDSRETKEALLILERC